MNITFYSKENARHALYLVAFFVLFSCNNQPSKQTETLVVENKKISIESISIDTIALSPPAFSGNGYFRMKKDTIYFFDLIFLTVSAFDRQGDFLYRGLGKGSGPKEIASFNNHGFMPNGNSFFLGTSYDLSYYTENWERYDRVKFIDWSRSKNQYGSRDVDKIGTYSFEFVNSPYHNKWLPINSNNQAYLSLWISPSVNPTFNSINGNLSYYKNAHSIGLLDISTGKVLKVFGNKPNEYVTYAFIPILEFMNYDLMNDSLIVSHAIGDQISIYDTNQNLVSKFGVEGKDMNRDYPNITSPEEHEKQWFNVYSNYGYYYSIFYSHQNQLIFRSYTKDIDNGGLQIYDTNYQLIGDLSVPKRFNIIGFDGEYYYADGLLNEAEDKLAFFKFKLSY